MPYNIEQFTIIHSSTPRNTLISVTEAIFKVKKGKDIKFVLWFLCCVFVSDVLEIKVLVACQ